MNWPSYNQSLVRRRQILLGFDIINYWDTELKEMNKDKIGEQPFHQPNTFLLLLGHAKAYFHLLYRQTEEGIAQGHAKGKVPSIPNYTTINRRINRLDIKIEEDGNKNEEFEDEYEYIVITIYSTGIKVTNRGQWMNEKCHLKNKKWYLKIHVAVNVKTKKILSMQVTDEYVHDSKALPGLVDEVIKSDKKIVIDKLIADGGAYDSNDIFRYLGDNGILPCIKVRKNSRFQLKKGNILRNLSVLHRKIICKSGKTMLVMESGGLLKRCFPQ